MSVKLFLDEMLRSVAPESVPSVIDVATAVDEYPLDTPPTHEGDDSVLAKSGGGHVFRPPQEAVHLATLERVSVRSHEFDADAKRAVGPPKARLVPLYRTLKLNSAGWDVQAVQRALLAARVRTFNPSGWYGPGTVGQVRTFQAKRNLRIDGVYGPSTHAALAPYFDDRALWLMAHAGAAPTPSSREKMVVEALVLVSHRDLVHYTQGPRRMEAVTKHVWPPSYLTWGDCSSTVTWLNYIASRPDPNGLGYNGQGYTGTLAQHGRQIPLAQVRPGDLGFYGQGTFAHVVMALNSSGRVFSHGSEGGPYVLNWDYRGDFAEWRTYD